MLDLNAARAWFARAPFIADLGVEPTAIGEGTLSTQLRLQPRHFQHTGQVHAGVMGTMADHTMGIAAQTLAAEGFVIITAELKLSLLRPGQGERLECEARVIKPGRTLSFTEAEVFAFQGEQRVLVLKASATMALVATTRKPRDA